MVLESLSFMLVVSIMVAFTSFLRQRQHFLLALLALELVAVFIVGNICIEGVAEGGRVECLMFIMLAVGACEASIGLSLLVFMVRSYGNDLLSSLSAHKL